MLQGQRMSRRIGQIVRLIGLAIEVSGLLATVFRTSADQTGAPLPGHYSSRQVWIVVGVGFVIWMIGTILTYWPQNAPRRRSSNRDVGDLKL